MVAPQGVHEFFGAHGLALARGQSLEYDAVARTQTSRAVHGHRAENGDAHAPTVLLPKGGVNETDTRWIPRQSPTGTGVLEN